MPFNLSSLLADSYQGDKGTSGEKGEKGDLGTKGDEGLSIKGETGEKGDQGSKGDVGPFNSFDVTTDTFSGNGSNTQFTLSSTPVDENHTAVHINGVYQEKSTYSVSGTTLTLSSAPTSSDVVEVMIMAGGAKGDKGDVEAQGNKGEKGSIGATGQKGDTGATGQKGDTGVQGVKGDTGAKGDTGETGQKGDTGDKGSTGDKGDTGVTGEKGDTGAAGDKGDTGSKGDTGAKGDTGSKGDTGLGFSIAKTYASVALLTADTSPTGITAGQFAIVETGNVEDSENSRLYLWDGSTYSYITDLSGAQGIKGQIGDKGDTGVTGDKGDTGATGSKGDKGDTGSQGDKGDTGIQGDKGDTGAQGDKGDTGTTGDKGETGQKGDEGVKGDKGDQGSKGEVGPYNSFDVTLDSFTGNGSNTQFTLSVTPVDEDHTIVQVGGVVQLKTSYSVSGTTLTFSAAPDNGASIEVTTIAGGAKGDKGASGSKGDAGDKGNTGDKGEIGVTGDKGSTGDKGEKGDTGAQGDKGEIGVAGDKGDTGQKGDTGTTGQKGDAGDKGDTGTAGQKGDIGIQGDKGDTGTAGQKGDIGDKGSTGDKGDQGSKGDVGPYNLFDVTLDSFTGNGSNTQFTLSVTPVDENHTNVVIDGVAQLKSVYSVSGTTITFVAAPSNGAEIEVTTIAGGAKGDKGDQGLKGDKGSTPDLSSYAGSIIPSANNTYDLGSNTMVWRHVYVGPGSLYVNGKQVLTDISNTMTFSTDADQSLRFQTSGTGNIQLDPTGTGVIAVQGTLQIEATQNITSSDGNAIKFSNPIATDSLVSKSNNTDLTLSANGTGVVRINDDLVITGNVIFSGGATTVNTEIVTISDNIIDLNSNFTTGTPTENAGIRVIRGDSTAVLIRWNETNDQWEYTNDGTTYSALSGAKGDKGDTGATGSKGDKGDVEAQGNKGEKGDKGIDGIIGVNGDKGEKGDIGTVGDKGSTGDKGDQGSKGDVGPYNLFDVTLDSFTGNGSNTQFTLSTTPVDENHVIVVIEGVAQLKSAYSVSGTTLTFSAAPTNGYAIDVTTIAGGAKGDRGDKGDSGSTGQKGDSGDKGEIGTAGAKGDTGATGDKGDTGAKGDQGDKGEVGPKGDTGTTGDKGSTGDKGDQGVQGTKGEVGSKGDKGELGALTATIDSFTGNGSNTQYTLSTTPSGEDYTIISVGGIFQHKDTYSVSGATLTFSEAPPDSEPIEVITYAGGAKGEKGEKGVKGDLNTFDITVDKFTGNGSNTQFTLSVTPVDEDHTIVTIQGITQLKNAYSVSGTTLTFSAAPANGDSIEVTTIAGGAKGDKGVIGTAGDKGQKGEMGSLTYVNRTYTGTGACTQFTVTTGMTNTSVLVTENGIMQEPDIDYGVSGTTLTFTTAPANNVKIMIRELPV